MTIVYFISSIGSEKIGIGGHFHSLKTISNSINSKEVDTHIFNVGIKPSLVLKNENNFQFFYYNGLNVLETLYNIIKVCKELDPDYYHAFDANSSLFANILGYKFKKPFFLNKCGGSNQVKFFPYSPNLILFSNDNFLYFKNKPKFNDSRLKLIPNRVQNFETNISLVEELINDYSLDNKQIFLRITRISKFYKKTIFQAINLINKIHEKNKNVCLLIIGTVQDQDVYIDLKSLENNFIKIIIDQKYVTNAKAIIDVSDFVIGTGRGFMEACSKNKIMLAPNSNLDYPVLVSDSNFLEIFNMNFSERYISNLKELNESFKNIEKLINKKVLQSDSKKWFDLYFSSEKIKKNYINFYKTSEYKVLKLNICIYVFFDFIYQVLSAILQFRNFKKNT